MKNDAKQQVIHEVDSVNAKVVALNEVSILISATGKTNTNGWKNPQLVPVVYVQPPRDRIWDYSFVAEKPEAANDVMTPVLASYQWNKPPGDVAGIRVIAKKNKVVASVVK
ncbi:MAG: hypothetical protein JWN74_931 [Acidobacteriaceae bacterium]|nr:hypothetical protein [Acidobacteriaceae bacterium]